MEEPSPKRNFVMSEHIPRRQGEVLFTIESIIDCKTVMDGDHRRDVYRAILQPGNHPARSWVSKLDKKP